MINKPDWSNQIIDEASIEHLDKEAIEIARMRYKQNKLHEEINYMSGEEFLTKIKLIQNGKITNTAMLLLGNEDYDYLFNMSPEASWRLYDSRNDVKDYKIFKIPFITLDDRILENVRNLTYRYMPNRNSLFTVETEQYNTWLLHELIKNCIAHTNYSLGGRIYINELEDQIILTNPGIFIPGNIELITDDNYQVPFYQNQLLVETMKTLNMIEMKTSGIKNIFKIQKQKYFPLPDYDLTNHNQVKVTLYGKSIDENYTRLLFDYPEFDIKTVYLLDKIQKYKQIKLQSYQYLPITHSIKKQLNKIDTTKLTYNNK